METICPPFWTNFTDHFENKFIYPFIKRTSLVYLRFIDDIFFIWTGNKKDLMKFLNELNSKDESFKFEHRISKTNLTLLDNAICIKNNKLYSKIYKKPPIVKYFSISNQNTLFFEKTEDFEYLLEKLKERFVNQGYKKKSINQQFSK